MSTKRSHKARVFSRELIHTDRTSDPRMSGRFEQLGSVCQSDQSRPEHGRHFFDRKRGCCSPSPWTSMTPINDKEGMTA